MTNAAPFANWPRANEFKSDWHEAFERMIDWWAGKPVDRVPALVCAPRRGVERRPAREDVPGKYTDPDIIFENLEAHLAGTFFGGEAFPCHWVYHGPVPMSAYFGGEPEFRPDTVWYAPVFTSWEEAHAWTFDRGNRWWRMNLDLTRRSLARARGRCLVSGCGLSGLFDVIANLWGTEPTLLAFAEEPETLAALRDRMMECFRSMYDEVHSLTAPHQPGSFDWLRVWAPGRIVTMQNDISCMISPRMFEALALDEIVQQARHVDHALYHLDGPGAIKHVELLLTVEDLDGIQWVPGAGASNDPMDWLDLLRRIQGAGKAVVVSCPPHRVGALLRRVDRRRIILTVDCPDEASAADCLAELDRIGTQG